jgi:hypothetical protein
MKYYFVLGLGVYIGLAAIRYKAFKFEHARSIILGFIACVVFWPIMLYFADKENPKE